MKITNNGKPNKTYYIEVNDKELELLCDAMDLKQEEELNKIGQMELQFGKNLQPTLTMIKDMAINLHGAYMGNI
jgi:hypothetical protein